MISIISLREAFLHLCLSRLSTNPVTTLHLVHIWLPDVNYKDHLTIAKEVIIPPIKIICTQNVGFKRMRAKIQKSINVKS